MRGKGKGTKASQRRTAETKERELTCKEDGQEYAQVLKMLGNGRCTLYCYDGLERLGIIRGKLRKKVWINVGDIVLVGVRGFQDDKVDIFHKYTPDEVRTLKHMGEIPENVQVNPASGGAKDDDVPDDDFIDFDDIDNI